jgi:hypothetical protein
VWKYVVSSKELKFTPAVWGPTPLLHSKITVDKQTKVIKLVAVLLKTFQKISAKDEFKQIAVVFGDICREYKTDEDVKRKVLKEIRSGMNDILKILQARSGHIKLCDLEYKERIDLQLEDFRYNLLGLEIDYADKEPLVYFKLFSSKGEVKNKKLIPEFSKSERSFAFLLRLAVAIKMGGKVDRNHRGFEGWLPIQENGRWGKCTGQCLYTSYQGLEKFRVFLATCDIFGLKEEEKRQLVRTKKGVSVIRLAIPKENIDIKINNLKNFASKFIDAKGENYEKGRNKIYNLIRDSLSHCSKYPLF